MASVEELLQTQDKCTGVINELVMNNMFCTNPRYEKQ